MLELAAIVLVSAVGLSFVTDAASGAVKMVRHSRRRAKIQVAEARHSA